MVDLAEKQQQQQQTQKTMTQMRPFWERDNRVNSGCPGDWSECCTTSSQLRGDGKHKSFARFAFTTIHSWLNQSNDVSCLFLLSAKFNEQLVISLSHMLFYLHRAPVNYFN